MRPDTVEVKGLGEALPRMRQGEKWQIMVPAALGYGSTGGGPIPAGNALIYELELLEVDVALGPDGKVAEPPTPLWRRVLFRLFQGVLLIVFWMAATSFFLG